MKALLLCLAAVLVGLLAGGSEAITTTSSSSGIAAEITNFNPVFAQGTIQGTQEALVGYLFLTTYEGSPPAIVSDLTSYRVSEGHYELTFTSNADHADTLEVLKASQMFVSTANVYSSKNITPLLATATRTSATDTGVVFDVYLINSVTNELADGDVYFGLVGSCAQPDGSVACTRPVLA
jgi:hypothetical protein